MVRVAVDGSAAKRSSDLASLDCFDFASGGGSVEEFGGTVELAEELTVELTVVFEIFRSTFGRPVLSAGITMTISVWLATPKLDGVVLSPFQSPVALARKQ